MAFSVRIQGYRGLTQLPILMPKQFNSDSSFMLIEPYEWAALLTTNGSTPVVSSPQAAPDKTTILRIEVADGQKIRYEINPPGRNIAASLSSPGMSGVNLYAFAVGWTISMIEATD